MSLRRSAIAASTLSLLALMAMVGCSREPGPTAPAPPPQITCIWNAAETESDREEIRLLELLARGHISFRFRPDETVIILWPTAEEVPPQMRPRAEEADE
jgi:hypothetical protein